MATIRRADAADADAIADIHISAWRATYAPLLPEDLVDSFDADQRRWLWHKVLEQHPQRNAVFVAVDGHDSVCGFGCCSALRDGPPGYRGEFQSIYLATAAQGSGSGRALMTRMAADLRDQGLFPALVWVLDANQKAAGFYRHMQGTEISRRPLARGHDEIAYGWTTAGDFPGLTG